MIENLIKDRCHSFPAGSVKLGGLIACRMASFFEKRIFSDEALNVVYRECIDAYRNRIDDAAGLLGLDAKRHPELVPGKGVIGIWQGEYWGKWIISAVRAARYTGDAGLREFICKAVAELLSLQDENGCISTYRRAGWFHTAPKEEVVEAIGEPCDWNWNIWARKYTLWGLLEAYELLKEPAILTGAQRLAENLLDTLERQGEDIHDTGTFCGMPSCSILKPMLILYRHTGKKRFLEFSAGIVNGWDRDDDKLPNLVRNAIGGKPVHEWFVGNGRFTKAKAYEMLSCYDGLLEYYRVTGDERCLQATEALYELLLKYESNRVGSVAFNDQFENADAILDGISEPCDSVHWMRLCYELFKLTGKQKYIDTFEFTFCNAFLAGIYRDGSWGSRGVRSSGRHLNAPGQARMKYNHCCVNNMPRGLLNVPDCTLMEQNGTLLVNLYFPGTAKVTLKNGNSVSVEFGGEFFTEGKVKLHFQAEQALKVRFRVPGWSSQSFLTAGGTTHGLVTGEFAEARIPAGESSFFLKFDNSPVIHNCPQKGEPEKLASWYKRRYRSDEGGPQGGPPMTIGRKATITAGPLILARSKMFGNTVEEMFGSPSIHGQCGQNCCLVPRDEPEALAAFSAEITTEGGRLLQTTVCDYASAGNVPNQDNELFSIFF